MTDKRMEQITKKWLNGYVCSLRPEEMKEYHERVLELLELPKRTEEGESE